MSIITVIGSSNTDLVVHTPEFPKPGETIIGNQFKVFAGGKGANQAVAAARLGAQVNFVGKRGNDQFGKKTVKNLKKDNINTAYFYSTKKHPSGVAVITINEDGQNAIVVSSGANSQLNLKEIDQAIGVIKQASIVLLQLEIPLSTVTHTIKTALKLNKKVILNPAPAMQFEDEYYKGLYAITPNETEVFILTGIEVCDEKTAEKAATIFLAKGVQNVIITLGEKGAYFKNNKDSFMVKAKSATVVDTTAAGDIFNGALAVAKAEGKSWKEAILFANIASSIGVSRQGAQASVPTRSEVDDFYLKAN